MSPVDAQSAIFGTLFCGLGGFDPWIYEIWRYELCTCLVPGPGKLRGVRGEGRQKGV